jgi:hypothetical protein
MLCWLQDLDPFDQNLDPFSRELLARLLNQIEVKSSENQKLTAENQRYQDELAYLKGHKGQPKIKPNRQAKTSQDSAQSKKNNPKSTIRPSSPPRKQLAQD